MSKLKVLDLFSGIGGFSLGLERTGGFETIAFCEIDNYCQRVLHKHWPNVFIHSDIRKLGRQHFEGWQWPDVVCGGDPCQENSNARQGTDTTSPSLGGEFIRIVDELRPRIVLRENPSVVRADAPWPWQRFRAELERLGYAVLPFELRACCIGADHKRERLFLLAELQDAGCKGLEGDEREVVERANGRERPDPNLAGPTRWSPAPRVCRKSDGIPNRAQRLRALGNSVVPQIAEYIGRCILAAATRDRLMAEGRR